MGAGDELLGDTLRSTVAEVVVRSLLAVGGNGCKDFAVLNTDGDRPTESELSDRLAALLR